jgi:hypothetical protein
MRASPLDRRQEYGTTCSKEAIRMLGRQHKRFIKTDPTPRSLSSPGGFRTFATPLCSEGQKHIERLLSTVILILSAGVGLP